MIRCTGIGREQARRGDQRRACPPAHPDLSPLATVYYAQLIWRQGCLECTQMSVLAGSHRLRRGWFGSSLRAFIVNGRPWRVQSFVASTQEQQNDGDGLSCSDAVPCFRLRPGDIALGRPHPGFAGSFFNDSFVFPRPLSPVSSSHSGEDSIRFCTRPFT